jgi:dipeptidyl aminopeptidase/acylaminoacyl peptidase
MGGRPRRPRVPIVIAVVLVLGACEAPERTLSTPSSSPPSASSVPAETPAFELPPAPADPPTSAAALPGRLLIRGTDGGMVVVRPDATAPRRVVDAGAGGVQVQQAAWSPDGQRIAWSQVGVENGQLIARLVVAAPDGTARREALTPFPAFYLAWDPTSSRVAFLGGEQPFTLGIVERRGAAGARPLARGAPFYLSWSPAGDRMVTHVGAEGLDELTVDGKHHALDTTGLLQAPSWGPDGAIAYVRPAAEGAGVLVTRDARSGRVRELAAIDGAGYLVVSPDGTRVAFHGRGPDEQDFFDRSLPETATELGVQVAALDGSGVVEATTAPALAWSWSPDGRRLAVLEPIYGEGAILFRWRVWSDDGSFVTAPFAGSLSLLQDAAFFTQFAQSTSMWAPDSSAFAFAAETEDGPVIHVQPATRGAQPFSVGPGAWVAWSPAA